MLALSSSPAYAVFVLNFNDANPISGASYKTYVVGDINSDFYQEVIIQKGFGTFQGDTGTASGGGGRGAANQIDPLSFAGGTYAQTGNASGNPTKAIIWQINKSQDMVLDFLKDKFDKKPRIIQSVVSTGGFSAEFSIDMRAIGYSDNTTVAPVINTQSMDDPFGGATPMAWDMAQDAQAGHYGTDAGQYTWTPGSGRGSSEGTYTYVSGAGAYDEKSVEWWRYFDTTDASNVWTVSTNKPTQ